MITFDYNLVRVPIENSKEWKDSSFAWIVKINGICFDYYTGAGLVKSSGRPKPPTLDDVLSSLLLDSTAAQDSFEEWCDNFGYDTDSRSALDTYLQCQESYHKLRKAKINIEQESERLQDY